MTPLPDEQLLLRAHKGSLLLTTHRLRYQRQGGGKAAIISMLLEEVDSCSMIRITHPMLLVCAGACLAVGLILGFQKGPGQGLNEILGGVLVAGIFLIAYLVLRAGMVEIASAATRILLDMEGWSLDEVIALFDQIEAAKAARLSGSVLSAHGSHEVPPGAVS